ncbi:unnamed protein product [Cuscuta europaea]|uniref:YLP motif-containing protein 1 n=1 Tax=Cuscuta europaea TaxID=41803 RepID=A0A9P0YX95_CUSEU|nr:unnamed protein product [Cuscuta europaea]
MAYSWRPPPSQPPPLQGERCPGCYYPHFPFCHPQAMYSPNPRLQCQPHPGHFYQRRPPPAPQQPAYDPFVDHQSSTAMHPHRPYVDGYVAHPSQWNQGVNFNSDPCGNLHSKDNVPNGIAGAKRMRSDDSSALVSEYYAKSARFSVDDERRLKLIHDHGGPTDQESGSRGDLENFEGHVKGALEFLDSRHWDEKQGFYELMPSSEQVNKDLLQSNGYGFSNFPANNNYNNVDHGRSMIQLEQSASGFTSENHSNDPFSDFHPKQNQYGSALTRSQAGFPGQLPLHASPPPLPGGTHGRPFLKSAVFSSPSRTTSSLFPIATGTSASRPSYLPGTEAAPAYYHANGNSKSPAGFGVEALHYAPSRIVSGENENYTARHLSLKKPTTIDAFHILKHPHRAARPDHIVVILRGLPGSGKSHLARMLRDLEVENGGNAPRIHSIDDYFMTEVEKVDESDASKSAGSAKGKKSVIKKVIEYCYEPEMEEAYRSSMLKAFKKTLDDGAFSFVIVDDRNLRVADFAQFWATAKRSGYEVYLLEAPYTDPAGCAARNVHGFTLNDIQKLSDRWEEAPSIYLKLDIKSLLHGDSLEHGAIQEVEMDMDDGNTTPGSSISEQGNTESALVTPADICSDGWDNEPERPIDLVKDLGKSKWSTDLDEDEVQKNENTSKKSNVSGLVKSHRKEGKTVRWGDEVAKVGFSIGATKVAEVSLVIGPGAGYNLKSNPAGEEESSDERKMRRQGAVFQEQLRAEHESFKAVFDRRRQRLVADED